MANPSLQIGNSNWAIKEDNLLGYSTAGTRFVPQPITMTRATAGTRVNPSGLVEDVELLGSEEITNGDFATDGTPSTNTWTLGWYSNTANVSISGGQITLTNSASESSSLAYATNGVSSTNILTTNQLYKLQYQVVANNGVTSFKYYSSAGSLIDAPIDLGVTHTIYIKNTANQLFLFQNATTNSNISLDNVSVKEATIDNLPRVDYTDGTSSLLVEPQRTNLITYSEDFSQSAWTKDETNIEGGYTAPDGSNTAYKVTNNGSNAHLVGYNGINTGNRKSIWAKTVSGTGDVYLLNRSENNLFSLTTEWQRFDAAHLGLDYFYAVDFRGASVTLSEVLIWGGQSEVGSYPTSYIPTSGSTVTRNQETYTKTGISDKINSTEGVLFAEIKSFISQDLVDPNRYITLTNGTSNERVALLLGGNNNQLRAIIFSSSQSVNLSFSTSSTDATQFNKLAVKYKSGDYAFFLNGTKIDSSSETNIFTTNTLNNLSLDVGGGTQQFRGMVKQLQVFKTALTDSELATLTT